MLKLFKYEMRKTLMAKLILLGLSVCLEGFFLYSIAAGNVNASSLSVILLVLCAILGIMFIGIQSIVTLHHDMNTKQSYMLFMTPNSNYTILGAKALECTVSVILAALFFFGLGFLDIRLLLGKFGSVEQLMDFVKQIMQTMNSSLNFDLAGIAAFVANTAAYWIETVLLAFFADVIATALLKGKKFGGLLTFVIFVALNGISVRLIGLIPSVGTLIGDQLVQAAAMLAVAVAVCIGSATIMEKKLSV